MRPEEGLEQVSEHALNYPEFLDYQEQPEDHECHALETASPWEEQRLTNQAGLRLLDSAGNVWKQQSKHLDLRKPCEYIVSENLDSCTRFKNGSEKKNPWKPCFSSLPASAE